MAAQSDSSIGLAEPLIAAYGEQCAPDWSNAATAIHAMRTMQRPVLLLLEVAGHAPLVLDFAHNVYGWDQPLDRLPIAPASVEVYIEPVLSADPHICPPCGGSLEAALWTIGLNSFHGALVWWLHQGGRYHLPRRPDLAEFDCTQAQLRILAMLGDAYLDPYELADSSASALGEAQRVLNALSLMGLLELW